MPVACGPHPPGLGDWHVGAPPDRRAIQAARRRGYDLTALRGRQVEPADFTRFGWILGMDDSNLRALTAMKPPDFGGHLGLLLDFAPETGLREVPDPYYGGPDGLRARARSHRGVGGRPDRAPAADALTRA